MPATTLTRAQARKLALLGQRLPVSGLPRGFAGTREAVRHLGYVQIDTISVVARAHHHTLWNRVPHYRATYPDRLIADRSIFEYWAHAAAYLPMENYRFCLPRMFAIRGGQRQWYDKDPKLMREVLARVRADGPLKAGDFDHHDAGGGMWEWGPVKQAIEMLFMEGRLMVTRREGFRKVFDLTERVIPDHIDTTRPTRGEYAHHLIERFLHANGIGRVTEFGYQRKRMGAAIRTALAEKVEAGEVLAVRVAGETHTYYAAAGFEERLHARLAKSRLKILSPFDNLVIQRKRIRSLFNFEYQLECYVPGRRRKHGYFVLPILWNGRLVARMDAKADRRRGEFIVHALGVEPGVKDMDALSHRLWGELAKFARFNQCAAINVDHISSPGVKSLLRTRTRDVAAPAPA